MSFLIHSLSSKFINQLCSLSLSRSAGYGVIFIYKEFYKCILISWIKEKVLSGLDGNGSRSSSLHVPTHEFSKGSALSRLFWGSTSCVLIQQAGSWYKYFFVMGVWEGCSAPEVAVSGSRGQQGRC